jgi:hypothetical protein
MTEEQRTEEALFRHAILGDVLSRNLKRGQLRPALKQLAQQSWQDHRKRVRQVAAKTLEEWYYKFRKGGFEALKPRPRKDRHQSRVLSPELEQLIVDMKREDPGRSARLILRELELAGRLARKQVSVSVAQRALRRHGLSGPRLQIEAPRALPLGSRRVRRTLASRRAARARSAQSRHWAQPACHRVRINR